VGFFKENKSLGRKSFLKIATVSENGTNISQHFGRAPLYVIVTAEDGKVIDKELRPRAAQNICACHHGSEGDCHEGHSHSSDPVSQSKHTGMADSIADCQVVIAGGMGYGAYQSLRDRLIMPIITDVGEIDEAIDLFLKGKLVNLMEKLH
jgi:predicted Fe-Mo cluster-binding NifX family protein